MRRAAVVAAAAALVAACGGGPNEGAAAEACRQFVERGRTIATFDDGTVTEQRGDLSWYVRSRFDPEDGAVVEFECVVTHAGDETWTLDELTLDGEPVS